MVRSIIIEGSGGAMGSAVSKSKGTGFPTKLEGWMTFRGTESLPPAPQPLPSERIELSIPTTSFKAQGGKFLLTSITKLLELWKARDL